jgi:rhodanese-related sulfurtransferase
MKKYAVLALILVGVLGFSPISAFAFTNVTPQAAYDGVTTDANTYLLDVRTDGEWNYVGHPGPNKLKEGAALSGKVINISWEIWKHGSFVLNPSFISDVEEVFRDKANTTIIVICRSGGRSVSASIALEAAGYANVFNLAEGFEGPTDVRGYRTLSGWKVRGLPYTFGTTGAYPD